MISAKKIITKIEEELQKHGFKNVEFVDFTNLYLEFEKLTLEQAIDILKEVKNHNDTCYNFVEYFIENYPIEKFISEKPENDIQTILFSEEKDEMNIMQNKQIGIFINNTFEKNKEEINKLKTNLNPHVVNWIEKDVKDMDIGDFNTLMSWIYKQKFGNE